MQEINVLDEKVNRIIKNKARRLYDIPLTQEDIEQELKVAIIDYCNSTSVDKRTYGAITVIINQKIYKLIREHSKFEGCCERSRQIRRNLNRPYSLDHPIENGHQDEDGEESASLMSILPRSVETHSHELVVKDFISHFSKTFLTDTERVIFALMVQGVNKPRLVCEELYNHREEKVCKIISKHMVGIRQKFAKAWNNEFRQSIVC